MHPNIVDDISTPSSPLYVSVMDEPDPAPVTAQVKSELGAAPTNFVEYQNPEGLPLSLELVRTPLGVHAPVATASTA